MINKEQCPADKNRQFMCKSNMKSESLDNKQKRKCLCLKLQIFNLNITNESPFHWKGS